MSRNLELPAIFKNRQFWHDFFLNRHEQDESNDFNLTIAISPAYSLTIIYTTYIRSLEIRFSYPESDEPYKLGWIDDAHPHPHLFRWAEAVRISEYLATIYENAHHPSIVLLLLYDFIRVTPQNDWEEIQTTLETAYTTLEIFDESDIASLIQRAKPLWMKPRHMSDAPEPIRNLHELLNRQAYEVKWVNNPEYGWVVVGDNVYSTRTPFSLLFENVEVQPHNFPREHFHNMLRLVGAL